MPRSSAFGHAGWLICLLLCGASLAGTCSFEAVAAPAEPSQNNRFLLVDAARLPAVKQRLAEKDPTVWPAWERLQAEADKALGVSPFSVIDDPLVPPSGDRRDYMSVGPYWWPNPDTDDGLPYVRRDGETNPDRRDDDSSRMSKMVGAVSSLAWAYYFSDNRDYADHAANLLRVWFIDDATRMNPHLNYGQAVPGRNEGRYIGIIDTVRLLDLLDPHTVLATTSTWTEQDQQAVQQWFAEYLVWLRESKFGQQERDTQNNHGTWYDAQVAAFALFCEQDQVAKEVLEKVPQRRIARHIEPDGSQPHELNRTLAFNYSCYNLRALMALATLGRHVDVDLWGYSTEDGRSIRAAVDWLAPIATGKQTFTHRQIRKLNHAAAGELFRRAGLVYDEQVYLKLVEELPGYSPTNRYELLHPVPQAH